MRFAGVAFALLAACGDDAGSVADATAIDAGVDAPDNPFEGMYDSPDDFPRGGCQPGAVGGFFPSAGVWNTIGLRTAVEDGALVTYVDDFVGEAEIAHALTGDDLIWRRSAFYEGLGWQVNVYDVCAVLAEDRLSGTEVRCLELQTGPQCFESELSAPRLRRITGEAEASGLSLLGEVRLEGAAANVRVADGVAYVPMFEQGMRIVSVADPAAPAKVGWWLPAEPNSYNDVKLMTVGARRYAVLAGYPSDVVDVTNPAAPFLAAHLDAGAHTLDVEGTMAYLVGSFSTDLWVYDLSVPTAPVMRAAYDDPERIRGAHDLDVENGIAYVSAPFEGLAIIDVRNPDAPTTVALAAQDVRRYWHSPWLTSIGGRPVVLHGDEGSGGTMTALDVDAASPTYLTSLGNWRLRGQTSLHNIMAVGPRAILAHYQDGIRVVDFSDPAAPAQLGYFNTWREEAASAAFYSGAFGLDLDPATRRVYVADSLRGLLVLDGGATVFGP